MSQSISTLTVNSFNPFNCHFVNAVDGSHGERNVTDLTGHKSYRTYGEIGDRLLFLLMTTIGLTINSVIAIFAYIITALHFLVETVGLFIPNAFTLKDKVINLGVLLLRFTILIPAAVIALEALHVAGVFFPNRVKKVYKSIETLGFDIHGFSKLFEYAL